MMKTPVNKTFGPGIVLLALLLLIFSLPAQAVMITKSFTGVWYQPDHESQGFDLQVIDQNGFTQALVYWYTYDNARNPMWLFGLGTVDGNSVEMDLMTVTGVKNLQGNNPGDRKEKILARAVFSFQDCGKGQVEIFPLNPASSDEPNTISDTGGVITIERLTSIKGTDCSGGLSDDMDDDDYGNANKLEMYMNNTGVYPGGEAELSLERDRSSVEFEVDVEYIPAGSYDLRIDGVIQGQIQVRNSGSETEGELEFESPARNGKPLLNFDPLDKLVEILEQDTVLFEVTFSAQNSTPGNPGNPGNPGSGAPPFANGMETKKAMRNTGQFPDARGMAELEQDRNEVEFEVEVRNLPVGNYDLYVDNIFRGIIEVENDDHKTEGDIEFRYPEEPGENLLDFDPRGKLVEVRMNGTTVLEVDF